MDPKANYLIIQKFNNFSIKIYQNWQTLLKYIHICIQIQIKVCIFQDESILNLIYVTEKISNTCNGSLIQKFLTVYVEYSI